MWNFFPLTHVATEQDDGQVHDAPSYLDTGQMFAEDTSFRNITHQEESGSREISGEGDSQGTSLEGNGDRSTEGDKGDPTEPMEEGDSFEKGDKSSTEDSTTETVCELTETSHTLTVKSTSEPMGLKSPLHRSLSNLPGEEATESLCVEVENESLTERLQDVESELEFLGYGREGVPEENDGRPRAKKRRLQVSESLIISERSWFDSWLGCCVKVLGRTLILRPLRVARVDLIFPYNITPESHIEDTKIWKTITNQKRSS